MDRLPVMVWKEGKAVWVEGPARFHDHLHHYPKVLCEWCSELATGVVYETEDVTLPDDTVRVWLPGRPHHYCRAHNSQAQSNLAHI